MLSLIPQHEIVRSSLSCGSDLPASYRKQDFFRTVNDMFLCELEGCIKRKRHKPTLSLKRFEELFRTFLLETYHRRISVKGRLAPSERWEEGGFLPRVPESLEQLDFLLMQEVRTRKLRRDGIHFQGLRYLSLTLATYVGEDVTIRFDPRDMGEIRVFYKDRFLCPVVSAELAGETIPLRDISRVRNQRRRELTSILHDRQQMVDSLLQLKNGPAPKEIQQTPPSYPYPEFASKGTATSSRAFVETIEYSRFVEFCDACRHFRCIVLR